MSHDVGRTARQVGRSLGPVGAAVLVSSLLGYALLVVVARLLPAAELATFMVFWSVLLGIGAALGPLEQDIARQSAEAAVDRRRTGPAALQVTIVGAVLVVAAGLVVAIPPLPRLLFGDRPELLVLAFAGGLACVAYLLVRGLLLGHDRVRTYGGLLVGENAIRLVLFGVVAAAGVAGVWWLAVASAAGYVVWLAVARSSSTLVDRDGPREPWSTIVRRVLALVVAAGLMASVLTGFPAMVGLFAPAEETAGLGTLFLTLTVARTPLLLLSPVQALTVPTVVRLSRDASGRRRLRTLLVGVVAGAVVTAAAGAGIAAVAGPWVVRLLFGAQHRIGGGTVAALVWSSVMLGAVIVLSAVLVARAQANRVVLVWTVIAATSVLALWLAPGDAAARAVLGITIAPTIGLGIAAVAVLRRGGDRSGEV